MINRHLSMQNFLLRPNTDLTLNMPISQYSLANLQPNATDKLACEAR